MRTWSEHKPHPEILRGSTKSGAANACRSVLLYGKNPNLARKVCGDALSFYQNQIGRTGGEPWSELQRDTGLSVEDVIRGLGLYNIRTSNIGLIIDETSSMYDNMDQVVKIVKDLTEEDQAGGYTGMMTSIDKRLLVTYGDPFIETVKIFYNSTSLIDYLQSQIVASGGNDCPELACKAIHSMVTSYQFYEDSPLVLFTDADSKDCTRDRVDDILREADLMSYKINFILTDTCTGEVDGNYTEMAAHTSGRVYLVNKDDMTNLTEILLQDTQASRWDVLPLPYYPILLLTPNDDWGYDYDWGYDDWRRRKRSLSNKMYSFYVDETVGSLTMDLVFKNRLTGLLDSSITVEPPAESDDCVAANRKTVGNLLHFKLECPCVGEWSVHVPRPSRHLLQSFNAQTYGEFNIDFDIAFEHVSLSDITEYPIFPCAGERICQAQWYDVRVSQLASMPITLILITESSKVTSHSLTEKSRREVWTALITVPVESFTVAVRGRTTEGNNFLRMRNKKVNPVETCLTTEWLPPYNVLKIGEEALIILSLKNIYGSDTYYLYCINEHQNRGVNAEIARPQSARLFFGNEVTPCQRACEVSSIPRGNVCFKQLDLTFLEIQDLS
eukprot:sb/3463098/